MQSEYATVATERVDTNILKVTLNRPRAANAINTQMGRDMIAIFEELLVNPDGVRCVVLTGQGEKVFCAGGDLKERDGMSDSQWRDQHVVFERMIRAFMGCPVPTIGAINGAAFGGGCEIAAACDFIYASSNARFALTEVTLGIMPGTGGTQNLPRAIGSRRALEVILTGTPFSARQGFEWGFVNKVTEAVDLQPSVLETARRIARNAPIAVRQAKQSVHRGLQMSIADGLAFEIEAYNRLVPTEDRREGVRAFNERREPNFTDR